MKIVEQKTFDATPTEIWQIVHQPGNMPAWNPKCVACDTLRVCEVGQRFKVTYEFKGKRSDAEGELTEYIDERLVRFRHDYEDASKIGSVDETFELVPKGDQTTLTHTVNFKDSGLPWWVRLLIGFLNRFGRASGPGALDEIDCLLKPEPHGN